jgi:2-haloacid dehalogenase
MSRIAVFDMNETTLDLAPVREAIGSLLGTPRGFELWFARLIQHSMVTAASGLHRPFGSLGIAALHAQADAEGVGLAADAADRVGGAMATLRPYPDVVPGLDHLLASGWRLIALTNTGQTTIETQLDACGLAGKFERVLSVDAVGIFKPWAAPYRHAAEVAAVEPANMWMVACHDWDLAGAKATGMSTAFVKRRGMATSPAYPEPDISADGFLALAALLEANESGDLDGDR